MKSCFKAFSSKLTLVMLALASMATSAMAGVRLSFQDISLYYGKSAPVTVLMDNDEEGVTNLQFDVTLPENMTLDANTIVPSSRFSDSQGVSMAQQPSGAYRFVITDTQATGFSGNSGAILSFNVTANATLAEGAALTFSNIVAVVNTVKLSTSGTDGVVTATEYVPETIYIETDLTAQFPIDWEGWTGATGFVGWAAPAVTTNDGRTTAACEKYESTCENTGDVFTRTLTGLTDGTYRIEVYGAAAYTSGRGFESELVEGDMTAVYLYATTAAGTVKQYIPAHVADNFNGTGIATAVLEGVEVVNGTVTIGMYKDKGLTNWHVVQIKGVTALVPAADALAIAVEFAENAQSDNLPAAVAQELATLINANREAVYETADDYIAAIAELEAAAKKAQACTIAADKLAAMQQLIDATNVYTADAYTEYYGQWAEAYERGTITLDEANALQNPFVRTEWHDATTVDNFLLSAWDTNPDFEDAPYYINTWSTEGETDGTNFKVPFFEYWVNDDSSLGEKTLTATMTGLAPGWYKVSAWVRVRATNSATAAEAKGITLKVNEGSAVDVTDGDTNGQFNLAEYEAVGEVGEDGVLTIQFIVAADNNISWLSFQNVKYEETEAPLEPYDAALAAIGDGGTYFISTNVEGTTYYVTKEGKLTSTRADGCIFTLTKTDGGAFKTYGYYIDGGGTRFTNAPLSNNQAVLNVANFSTTTDNRQTWEAQVLFLQDGKYAIRATNAASATSSWGDAGRVFFTWKVDDVAVPQYTYDEVYQWNLEAATPITVSYQLTESDGTPVGDPVTKKQEANSEVSVPASFTSIAYYDYVTTGTIGDEDCTITVTRSFKAGVVHSLADLSNAKAYTIRCDRGAFLTKDGYLASTAHSTLSNAQAADFALISYEDNLYLYSVADGKFVQNTGALADMPMNGIYDAIVMEAKTDPYFFTYFKIDEETNHGLNTNGNDPYGYVINTWMNADQGNQYYMIESADFDATAALAALEAYFHPSCFVTYVVKDNAGNPIFTSEEEPAIMGATITTLPAEFQHPFYTYNEINVTISDTETTAEFTATWVGPFELSTSEATATWYNMTIRGNYYVAMDESEPYYPKTKTAEELLASETQWAFVGDAYNGIYVFNKAAGSGFTLTKDGSNVVMREGLYAWAIGKNSDGFTLKEIGTEYNCINQNGGSQGPLQFWDSASSPSDNGSTFRVTEAQDPVDYYRAVLSDAIDAATAAADVPTGGLFMKSEEAREDFLNAIADQQTVAEDAEATLEAVQNALIALADASEEFADAPVITPAADAVFTFQQKESGLYLSVYSNDEGNGVVLSETPTLFSWVAGESGYYLQAGSLYVGLAGSNAWTMSALEANKAIINANPVLDSEVVYYTLATANGFIGSNEAGSAGYPNCYADKTAANDFTLWTLAEATFTQGDVDFDGSIDVADHAVIRDFIINGGNYYPVYDINMDQSVSVADLTAIVNLILGLPIDTDEPAGVRTTSTDLLTLNYLGNGRYALQLQSGRSYNGFQMDLNLPEGMTLVSENVNGNHQVVSNRLANGLTRILVYSMENAAFESTDILYLNVMGEGTITAENIIFADARANAVTLTLGYATGINGIQNANADTIYDLSGRKIEKAQQRGVYIVNGKKVAK